MQWINVANTIMTATEASAGLSVIRGATEGIIKGLTNAPPDIPYLINMPIYQTSSDVFNFWVTFLKNRK